LYSTLQNGIEKYRVKNYIIYYGISTNPFTDLFKLEISGNPLTNLARIKNFYTKNKNDISCSELGFGLNYNSKNNQNLEATGILAAKRHLSKDDQYFNYNKNILNEIINITQRNKVKLILYTSPAYKTYRQNLYLKQLNQTTQYIAQLTHSLKDVYYYNLLSDSTFNSEDFFDADHLNEKGAEKLTRKIDGLMNDKINCN